MADNKTIRRFIRHPTDMPIRVALDWAGGEDNEAEDRTIINVSLGGLAFVSQEPLEASRRVRISIPVLEQDSVLVGTVVWCQASDRGYEVGVEFDKSDDVYRLRMVEQICHIEHYRREVARLEGRELSAQEAAVEWIRKFAGDFPAL